MQESAKAKGKFGAEILALGFCFVIHTWRINQKELQYDCGTIFHSRASSKSWSSYRESDRVTSDKRPLLESVRFVLELDGGMLVRTVFKER
jgi:hypothetical protein